MTETERKWVHLDPHDLVSWRMEHGLTRRQLAMHFQVSTSSIRSFERGDAVPPEWMQDRMVSTILDGSPPQIDVPRGRHRRYRWSKLSSDALYRWRRESGLTQAQAAALLGCSPASISAWERNERAPDRDTQIKLRDGIQGYDDGSFPRPVPESPPTTSSEPPHELPTGDQAMTQPSPQTANLTSADEDVGSSRRAQSIMDRIDSVKLPEKLGEARYGRVDGFVVMRSNVTGAHYMIEGSTGRFFRTHTPRATRITSDSPKGVVAQDRAWLYPLLGQLPEGKAVLARYNRGEAPVEEKKMDPAPAAPTSPAVHQLVDLAPVVEEKRITMVERTGKLPIRPDHLHAMLRASGVKDAEKIPLSAKITVDADTGNVVLTWDLGLDQVDE